jgi:hypothetical protein
MRNARLEIRVSYRDPCELRLQARGAVGILTECCDLGSALTRTGTGDFKWTQPGLDLELRIACEPHYYEDNSDSYELWVPGSPLFPIPMRHQWGAGSGLCGREDVANALSIPR